jgi:integrase-like protein
LSHRFNRFLLKMENCKYNVEYKFATELPVQSASSSCLWLTLLRIAFRSNIPKTLTAKAQEADEILQGNMLTEECGHTLRAISREAHYSQNSATELVLVSRPSTCVRPRSGRRSPLLCGSGIIIKLYTQPRAFLGVGCVGAQQGGEAGVQLPRKPTDNPYIESFNGRLRSEGLNQHWFESLAQVCEIIEQWRKDYNEQRPHTSLGWLSPQAFNTAWQQARAG